MRKFIFALTALLFVGTAHAQHDAADLMNLGFNDVQAESLTDGIKVEQIVVEDGTAASACVGSGTLTAATPLVVSTTCINTGDYVFITRTSSDTSGAGQEWVSTIVDGTSFAVTSVAGDTATFNWLIVKGQ